MTPYPDTTPAALDLARYDYDCYERATRETAGAYDCAEPFEPYPHDEREPGGDALALLDAMLADADPRAHSRLHLAACDAATRATRDLPPDTPWSAWAAAYDDAYESTLAAAHGVLDWRPRAHDDDPPELCTPHPDAAERLADCPTYLC